MIATATLTGTVSKKANQCFCLMRAANDLATADIAEWTSQKFNPMQDGAIYCRCETYRGLWLHFKWCFTATPTGKMTQ